MAGKPMKKDLENRGCPEEAEESTRGETGNNVGPETLCGEVRRGVDST